MVKLLAAIDGSIYSESVCDHTAWLADGREASIELLHVLGRRIGHDQAQDLSGSLGFGARSHLLGELAELDARHAKLARERGRAILEDAEARLRAAGVTVIAQRLRHDEIPTAIDELGEACDIIVIGKRGEGADFNTLHLGSNLERIVRGTNRPVLVASRAFQPIRRCLIAFDGGRSAFQAVNRLAERRWFGALECLLLHVGTERTDLRRELEGAASQLRAAGHQAAFRIAPGQADAVIAETVKSESIDLLLMGSFGHSRVRRLIIGSTSSEMIRSCLVPVMLFR